MKILSRIVETILIIVILASAFLATDEGCSCGECYADEIRAATVMLFISIGIAIVMLLIKSKKYGFRRCLLEFLLNLCIIVECVLVIGFVIGFPYRIKYSGLSESVSFGLPLLGFIAIAGGLTYVIILALKKSTKNKE